MKKTFADEWIEKSTVSTNGDIIFELARRLKRATEVLGKFCKCVDRRCVTCSVCNDVEKLNALPDRKND